MTAAVRLVRAIVRFARAGRRSGRRREATHPGDEPYAARLTEAHARLNAQLFDGTLRPMTVRVSRRMKRKLGHYSLASGEHAANIAIGRWHIRRDAWEAVVHTLLHEMVHQWQQESGLAVAHDRAFRAKAREVGIDPRAVLRRDGGPPARLD